MIVRRLIIALVIAIAVSGGFTFWLSKRFASARASSSQLQYVATSSPLEAGDILKPEYLKKIDWPRSKPLEGAFVKPESLIGRAVLYPLASGEPILERQLAAAGSGSGLATKIPAGMRALSLKSDQVVGVAGFLLPGTHVDVLVTFHTPSSPDPVTSTVLQDARVLAAGQKTQPDPEGKASTVDVVTILVSPSDAEKLVLATAQGTVRFVLRNSLDHAQVNEPPTQMSALGQLSGIKPVATQPRVQKSTAPAAPKKYSVEVVRGDKQTLESF